MTLPELYAGNPAKACKLALRRTLRLSQEERMEAINKLLDGHGVEAIRGDWQNGYWCDIVATYVNMGDTYDTTIMHVRGNNPFYDDSRFIVSSVGDWVERNEKQCGIL